MKNKKEKTKSPSDWTETPEAKALRERVEAKNLPRPMPPLPKFLADKYGFLKRRGSPGGYHDFAQ